MVSVKISSSPAQLEGAAGRIEGEEEARQGRGGGGRGRGEWDIGMGGLTPTYP